MQLTRAPSFGPEYEQLLLTAFANPPFRLQLTSRGQVMQLRAKVYQYFRLLRCEQLRLDLIEMADALQLVVDGDTLVFALRADSWDATLIREALGLGKGFAANGNAGAPGNAELQLPDLLGSRLAGQVKAIRERRAGVTPMPIRPYNLHKK